MKEGYTVFSPLVSYNANDIVKVLEQVGIPTISVPCKFKEFRPKRILEKYYEKMGMSFDYKQVFDFVRKSFSLPDITTYTLIDRDEYLKNIF